MANNTNQLLLSSICNCRGGNLLDVVVHVHCNDDIFNNWNIPGIVPVVFLIDAAEVDRFIVDDCSCFI